MTLREMFRDDFASSAFQTTDGEPQIVGKFGRITQFPDGSFDCWFVGPDLAPLTAHKITAIRKKCLEADGFRELTGEAYTQGRGKAFVSRMAALAGVKKKRRVTRAMRENLDRMRAAQSNTAEAGR